jgi:hypothetical protein
VVLLQHFIFAAGSNAVQIASEGMGGLLSCISFIDSWCFGTQKSWCLALYWYKGQR